MSVTARARRFPPGRDSLLRLAPAWTLSGRRYRFHPTLYGLLYTGMIAALLVGSINHNNNLGYLLTFLLGSMLLVAVRSGWRNLREITVTGGRARPVFAGREARFDLHLQAEGDRCGLLLALDPDRPVTTDLRANGGTSVELALPAARRGVLQARTLHLWTSFPLGLCTVRTTLPVELDCLVYPQPLPGPYSSEGAGEDRDRSRPRAATGGREFSGLAAYRPGDSLQQLHWKSFARGQGLHTRVFAEEESGGAIFSLDRVPGKDLEHRLSRLCHLILTAEAGSRRYGLRLGATTIGPNRGPGHRDRCLRALALH